MGSPRAVGRPRERSSKLTMPSSVTRAAQLLGGLFGLTQGEDADGVDAV